MPEWYRISADEALAQTATARNEGLSSDEAARRLTVQGSNELVEAGAKSPWRILLEQFTSVLIVILILAAVISTVLGDHEDAIAILAVLILNAVLGFRQEHKAEKTMQALRRLATPVMRVRRDGKIMEVSARDLVTGDLVLLEAGNMVPADCRLVESVNLRAQEAALTGESEPVEKIVEAIQQAEVPLGDQLNVLFMGTAVSYGRGVAVVVATGMDTELGRIAGMLQKVHRKPTPLQERLAQLGRWLALAALVLVAIIFAEGLIQGESVRTMFLTAVSMAVAAVPEGLPAIVTIALSLGAQRMLRRHALIRKLPAVETLGSVTVICSDKTGTLTQNRMTVVMLDAAGHEVDLVEVLSRGRPVPLAAGETGEAAALLDDAPSIALLVAGGALCNDSLLVSTATGPAGSAGAGEPVSAEPPEGLTGLRVVGDPTEASLVTAAARLGLPKTELETAYPRVAEIPFDSERKLMTTVHSLPEEPLPQLSSLAEDQAGAAATRGFIAFTKGASDAVLPLCAAVWDGVRSSPLDQETRQKVEDSAARMAERGMRVLAVAYRFTDDPATRPDLAHLEQELVLSGIVGMIDPPRDEAREAVLNCVSAGIRPVMITGDHPLTAASIASQVGIVPDSQVAWEERRVLTGVELDRIEQSELESLVGEVSVYARVAPEHKMRIIQALRNTGQIAAMTGDGVNDAPALRSADIGVAMGITGTDVAKEAADMVLLDDDFATIVAAVKEGRVIYDNIRKFIKYLMATNVGELFVMLVAPFLGMPLPLLPLQILWMNLVTDGLPGLALGFEPPEKAVMRRPPHPPTESIFARGLGTHVLWSGPFMGLTALLTGFVFWRMGSEAWQTMLFTVLTFGQLFHVMAIRSDRESLFTRGPYSNPVLFWAVVGTVLLQMVLIYTPVLQGVFELQPLTYWQVLLAFGLASLIFWAIESLKYLGRRRERGRAAGPSV
jgi:Ca2+-transporting ATPase